MSWNARCMSRRVIVYMRSSRAPVRLCCAVLCRALMMLCLLSLLSLRLLRLLLSMMSCVITSHRFTSHTHPSPRIGLVRGWCGWCGWCGLWCGLPFHSPVRPPARRPSTHLCSTCPLPSPHSRHHHTTPHDSRIVWRPSPRDRGTPPCRGQLQT